MRIDIVGFMRNFLKNAVSKTAFAAATTSLLVLLGGQFATADPLPENSFQVAQNTAGQPLQQQQRQNLGQQAQFYLSIENRSGVDLDVLRVVNGQYARLGVLQNNFGNQYQTFTNDQLFFGYGGQILNSFVVPQNATRPLQIGPDILASYQNPNPQQQRQNQGGLQGQQNLPSPPGSQQGFFPDEPQNGNQTQSAQPAAAEKPWPYIDKPWDESPPDAILFGSASADAGFLSATPNGGFEYTAVENTLSSGVWLFDEEEGTDFGTIRNLQEPGKSLYIDQNAGNGTAVLYGPEGIYAPGGKWKIVEDGSLLAVRSELNPNLSLSWNDGLTVTTGKGIKAGAVWFAGTIESMLKFMGIMSRTLPELDKATKKADQEYAAILAEEERQRQAKEAEKARQLEEFNAQYRANQRKIAKVYKRADQPNALSVQLGVQEPFQLDNGTIQQNFEFATNNDTWLESRILKISAASPDEHVVDFKLVPKVTAYVQNGLMYLEVGTDTKSIIGVSKNGKIPPTNEPKDTFFIGGVRLTVAADNGAPTSIFPINENSRLDRSRSSDTSEGFDVSADSVGFNQSKSTGSGLGATIQNYKVTGNQASQTLQDRGVTYRWAEYNWTACGLSTQSTNLNDCSYNSPVDLWQDDGAVIYELKDVALSMNVEPTTTIFQINATRASMATSTKAIDVSFGVDVELHALTTRDIAKTKNEDVTLAKGWKAFKGGFKTAARLDKIDLDKGFMEQEVMVNELTERIPLAGSVRFDVVLRVDVSDLAQFLN
ncbi:MAG: cell envelope integrity protein TolA [Hyphomicrobiales bacterium]